jgi:uncharacterized repeat protein (TIGR01451 family)
VIEGNLIGTNAAGNAALTNSGAAVRMESGLNHRIGGTSPPARNVLSGNGAGVFVGFTSRGTVIQGNLIGTDATGTSALGNVQGVVVNPLATFGDVTIGGTEPGAGNVIAFNTLAGVGIGENGTGGNVVLSNSIFSNGSLGIDLVRDGVTPNDPGDADTGPNNLQNFPVITKANAIPVSTEIEGTLNSTPDSTFLIQFFANDQLDPSSFGEGEQLIGETTVTTDGSGDAGFSLLAPVEIGPLQFVTSTATLMENSDGDENLVPSQTSEFSEVYADLSVTKSDNPDPVFVGQELTYTLTVHNAGPFPALNVTLVDSLPQNIVFVRAATEQGTHTLSGSHVTFDLGALRVGATVIASITVRPTQSGFLGNIASVGSSIPDPGQPEPAVMSDPNSANNQAIIQTQVDALPTTDLQVAIAAAATVNAGAELTYTIVVSNLDVNEASPFGPALDAVLSEAIPAHTTFVSFTAPPGWTAITPAVGGSGAFTARRPSMDIGEGATFQLVVRVGDSTPGGTVISNSAEIATLSDDTDPGNNAATAQTTVIAPIAPPTSLTTFTLVKRSTAYRNEFGIFLIDAASGKVGARRPRDRGYARAAMARRQVLFTADDPLGAVRTLNLPPGTLFGFYLVQNGTSADFMSRNGRNRPDAVRRVFFSFAAANPGGFGHLRRAPKLIAIEDMTRGGDKDFNDLVVRVNTVSLPSEPIYNA